MKLLASTYCTSHDKDTRMKTTSILGTALSIATLVTITGCGLGTSPSGTGKSGVTVHQALHGKVHGGQQPISGSTVQLYAVGTSAVASAATPLLANPAITDANGFFSLTGQYACPQYGSLVYATASGGNPGLTNGTNNAAISLLAAVGPCTYQTVDGSGNTIYTLDPNSFISLNEVTTVASVYALAPFMADAAHIGSGNNTTGITNAFTTVAMLADISGGTTPGTQLPSTVTYDPATGFPVVINTLANIIAACINTDGTTNGCNQLFAYTTSSTGSPADTVAAMLSIVKHPANHVSDLLDQVQPSAPFSPSLTAAPNDWTVALHYTNANLSSPSGIAFDSLGDLWITNRTSTNVTELYSGLSGNTAGLYNYFSPYGLLGAQALAIDSSNNVWIANTAGNSVIELDQNGNDLSGPGYTAGGINAPIAIAIDSNNNAWVANYNGNSITQLYTDGSASGFSPLTAGYSSYAVSQPTGIAIDGSNHVWVSNSGLQASNGLATQVLNFDQNGNALSFTSQTIQNPLGLAIDASNNVWIASNGTAQVGAITSSNGAIALNSGGGISQPFGVAIDSAGTVWVSNSATAGSVSEISSAGAIQSPSTGFGSLMAPLGVAVDPSGNLWTANSGDNSLTQFVGIAAPTTTPVISKVEGLFKSGRKGA
jgi:streptogramin lyase